MFLNRKILFTLGVLSFSILVYLFFYTNESESYDKNGTHETLQTHNVSKNNEALQQIDKVHKSNKPLKIAYSFSLSHKGVLNSDLLKSEFKQNGNFTKSSIPIGQDIQGNIQLKYYEQENNTQLYIARLNISLKDNPHFIRFGELLEGSFIVQKDQLGNLSLYDTHIPYDSRISFLLKELLPHFQFIGMEHNLKAWNTLEKDSYGEYEAYYTKQNRPNQLEVTKQKLGYKFINPLPDFFDTNLNIKAQIHKFQSTFTFEPTQLIWPQRISSSEEIGLENDSVEILNLHTQFSANFSDFDDTLVMSNDITTLKKELILLNKKNEKETLENDYEKMVSQKTLNEMLSYYIELIQTDKILAQKLLIVYLRLYPNESKNLVDYLFDTQYKLSSSIQLKMWSALAMAGHKEAQDAYIYSLSNTQSNDLLPYYAIGQLRFFDNPSEEFIDALWNLQNQFANNQRINTTDQNLAGGIIFAIATLSNKDEINPKLKTSILETLKNMLGNTMTDSEKRDVITAMGNTHDGSLIENIIPYLDVEDSNLQQRAFEALSRMPSDVAIEPFLQGYEKINIKDETLQYYALESLQNIQVTNTIIDWASKRVLEENNMVETTALVRLLGKNSKNYSNAEESLRNLLSKTKDAKLKLEIYKYITP